MLANFTLYSNPNLIRNRINHGIPAPNQITSVPQKSEALAHKKIHEGIPGCLLTTESAPSSPLPILPCCQTKLLRLILVRNWKSFSQQSKTLVRTLPSLHQVKCRSGTGQSSPSKHHPGNKTLTKRRCARHRKRRHAGWDLRDVRHGLTHHRIPGSNGHDAHASDQHPKPDRKGS